MHSKKQVAGFRETGSCFKWVVKFAIEAASALAIALERGELWRWIGSTHFGRRHDRRDSSALVPFIPPTLAFEMEQATCCRLRASLAVRNVYVFRESLAFAKLFEFNVRVECATLCLTEKPAEPTIEVGA